MKRLRLMLMCVVAACDTSPAVDAGASSRLPSERTGGWVRSEPTTLEALVTGFELGWDGSAASARLSLSGRQLPGTAEVRGDSIVVSAEGSQLVVRGQFSGDTLITALIHVGTRAPVPARFIRPR